jgi:putative zinc finger/helix-turn-helix YgiT family protein
MEEEVMRCPNCAGETVSCRENHQYRECGLDYVTLVNVEVIACQACGARGAVIPGLESLHRVIARTVAQLPWCLDGREIRFLRKYLGFSAADFANALATRPETISRWENDKANMSESMERFLRLMVFNQKPAEAYPQEELARRHERRPKKKPATFLFSKKGSRWAPERTPASTSSLALVARA